jgi:anti-sigma factor RsiW
MSGNDQMTDRAELRELRNSLSGVTMPERPRLEAITARGRARRRRRRLLAVAGLSVAAAAGTALALGLTGEHSAALRGRLMGDLRMRFGRDVRDVRL